MRCLGRSQIRLPCRHPQAMISGRTDEAPHSAGSGCPGHSRFAPRRASALAFRSFSTSRNAAALLCITSLVSDRRVNRLRQSRSSSKHNRSSRCASSARYLRLNEAQPLDVWRWQCQRFNAMLGPASRTHRSAPTRFLVIPIGHSLSTRMRKPSSPDMLSRARFTSRVPAAYCGRCCLDAGV
jgi:hypothetical protein